MTAKTAVWFDENKRTQWWRVGANHLNLFFELGRVIYTTARIRGKETRVRIWFP